MWRGKYFCFVAIHNIFSYRTLFPTASLGNSFTPEMPSLTSVAEGILAQAKKLDAYLESNNIPYPSFDEDTLDKRPDKLQDDRWALANSSNELKKLARGAAMGTMDTMDTALNVGNPFSPRFCAS